MCRRLSVAATSGKASEAANRVSHGKSWSEGITGSQCRHLILAEEPGCNYKRRDQSSGKYAAGLQGVEGKYLAKILSVGMPGAPIENYVENLRADNSSQYYSDSEVPGIFSFYSLPD